MPGELLPTMAAPSVPETKSALTLSIRGKPDLYLIVRSHTQILTTLIE